MQRNPVPIIKLSKGTALHLTHSLNAVCHVVLLLLCLSFKHFNCQEEEVNFIELLFLFSFNTTHMKPSPPLHITNVVLFLNGGLQY